MACLLCLGLLWLWRGVVGKRSQLFGPSIARGATCRRTLALTFDDGPSPSTIELLRYLADEGVHATFFVCGANVMRHPDIARALLADGHELGNHTFSHRRLCPRFGLRMNFLSPSTVLREIELAQQAIVLATGLTPQLFRAPYGLRWFGVRGAQRSLGLLGVLWTVIGHDWEWEAERVAAHVLSGVAPGCILCLHDGRDTREHPDVRTTLAAVRLIVPELKRRGYAFETVTELLVS